MTCHGDCQDCSFESTKDIDYQLCDHLSYPEISFRSFKAVKVSASSGYTYDFSQKNINLESFKDTKFAKDLPNQANKCKQSEMLEESSEEGLIDA